MSGAALEVGALAPELVLALACGALVPLEAYCFPEYALELMSGALGGAAIGVRAFPVEVGALVLVAPSLERAALERFGLAGIRAGAGAVAL